MEDHGFRLPTEEEKKQYIQETVDQGFRLPTEEERIKYTSSLEEPSGVLQTIEDVARLGGQGLSASFSDEALAALKAAGEVAGTEKTLKDLPALYEQYKQIERRKIEEARERSPVLGTAAEIAGAIAPAFFSGGTSLAVKGAAKLLPAIAKSTSAAGTIGRAALTGAQYGGVAAAGAMESPILSAEGVEEIAKGAALGGALGGVTAGGAEAAKGAYRALSPESRTIKLTGRAFQEAAEGRPSPTSVAGEGISKVEEESAAKGFAGKFLSKEKTAPGLKDIQGENIAAVAKMATEQGVKIGENPEIVKNIESLTAILKERSLGMSPKQRSAIENLLTQYGEKKQIDPDVANEARRQLFEISKKLKPKESEDVLGVLRNLSKGLGDELIEKVEGFAEANLKYQKSMEVLDTLLGKGKRASEVRGLESKVETGAENLIKRGEVLGEVGVKARRKLANLKEAAKKAFELDPESFKKAGINAPEDLFKEIERQGELSAIRQGLGGVDRAPGMIGKLSAFLNLAHPYQLARYGGFVAKKASDVAALAYKLPDAGVIKFADVLSKRGISDSLVKGLRDAVASGNVRAKNAALFSLLQKKEVRAVLGEEDFDQENKELP